MGIYIKKNTPPGNKRGYKQVGFNDTGLSQNDLEELADELINWADELESLGEPIVLSSFAVKHGLTRQDLYKYCEKNEKLHKAREYAKTCANSVMLQGIMKKDAKFDFRAVQFVLTHTDNFLPKERKKSADHSARNGINRLCDILEGKQTPGDSD